MDHIFTLVNDDVLVNHIGRAHRRLVFVAPGIRPPVAKALARAMDIVPTSAMHLVLDVDAEVCRLGYGDKDFKGMEILLDEAGKRGLTVNHHPGIRIGLLIADDTTLIYSPTPMLIEAGSKHADKPNAIVLQSELPPQLANACAVGEAGLATLEVGKDSINPLKVQEVKRDLEERPPKEYNVARVERVFSSMLHCVELRITDYKLASRSLSLDPQLFGVTNAEVVRRLTNRYRLFAETDSLMTEIPFIGEDGKPREDKPTIKFGPRSIDEERKRIKNKYIIEAGDFGLIILRRNVANFEKEIAVLKSKIEEYKKALKGEIRRRTEEIVNELLAAMAETLKANPPDNWRTRYMGKTPTDADIKRLFKEDVESEVKRVNTDFNPRIFYAYKDVTYQTFKDDNFRTLLEDRFGKEAIDQVFAEYDAAPEQAAVTRK